jgi:hypothetical protein
VDDTQTELVLFRFYSARRADVYTVLLNGEMLARTLSAGFVGVLDGHLLVGVTAVSHPIDGSLTLATFSIELADQDCGTRLELRLGPIDATQKPRIRRDWVDSLDALAELVG